jgi:hypothetical protein
MNTQNLLKIIKDCRFYTDTELSKLTGVPQPTLSRIRRGFHKKPHLKTEQKLSGLMGLIEARKKELF